MTDNSKLPPVCSMPKAQIFEELKKRNLSTDGTWAEIRSRLSIALGRKSRKSVSNSRENHERTEHTRKKRKKTHSDSENEYDFGDPLNDTEDMLDDNEVKEEKKPKSLLLKKVPQQTPKNIPTYIESLLRIIPEVNKSREVIASRMFTVYTSHDSREPAFIDKALFIVGPFKFHDTAFYGNNSKNLIIFKFPNISPNFYCLHGIENRLIIESMLKQGPKTTVALNFSLEFGTHEVHTKRSHVIDKTYNACIFEVSEQLWNYLETVSNQTITEFFKTINKN